MAFETKYICDTCQPPYTFIKMTDKDPRKEKCRTPACPQCRQRRSAAKMFTKINGSMSAAQVTEIRTSRPPVTPGAPAIHNSTRTKAIDETARIVMQDHQMTDINLGSNLREGDNCVPKLSHELERQVDGVFSAKAKNNVMGLAGDNLTKALTKQINANAFKNYGDPVARQQADPNLKPRTNVMYHHDGKPSVN